MTLAYMDNAAEFGMLTTFATLSAFFADILISPALMVLGVDRPARIGSPADASAIADGPSASRPPLSPRS
jgi:hypothetical protein